MSGGAHLTGRKWYTDGMNNRVCVPGTEPSGFRPGVTAHHSEMGREIKSRRMVIYNRKRWGNPA